MTVRDGLTQLWHWHRTPSYPFSWEENSADKLSVAARLWQSRNGYMHTVFPTGEDEAHGDCLLSMVSDALGCAKMPCAIFEFKSKFE
jgi:hypothetical protein